MLVTKLIFVFGSLSLSSLFIYLYWQQDLIREAGMRSVRQACGKTFEEVEDFLKSETFPVVSDKNAEDICYPVVVFIVAKNAMII